MACRTRLLLLMFSLVCASAAEEIQRNVPESLMPDVPDISDDVLNSMITESRKQVESEENDLPEDESHDFRTLHRKQADEREARKRAMAKKTFELVTEKLVNKLGLKPAEDSTMLSAIKAKLFKRLVCPCGPAPSTCETSTNLKYRTANGECNNLIHTNWGSSFVPYERLIRADYADGKARAWVRRNKKPLPNTRLLSVNIFSNRRKLDKSLSDMSMIWGQFLAHDILHSQQPKTNCPLRSCFNQNHDSCFGILIRGKRDREFPRGSCIAMKRDEAAPLGCTRGVREQLNGLTAFIDASGVYGDTQEQAQKLRGDCGLLKMTSNPNGPRYKNLLPTKDGGFCRTRQSRKCFASGDPRTNENAGLSSLHTIFAREHNRIVKELKNINPRWDCERLYQEARKIVGAMQQHITFNEYLPEILDPSTLSRYRLKLGSYAGYNKQRNPGISNSFATATFRFGHSQIREVIDRFERRKPPLFTPGKKITPIQMDRFFDPDPLYDAKKGGCDSILRGLAKKRAEGVDGNFAKAVQHRLQTPEGRGDLPAINTQRGRDHGLATYNKYRQLCNLRVARTFQDFKKEIKSRGIRRMLARLYRSPDNVDLFVGGILEDRVRGGAMGPTFSCLMGKQFKALREGDRFWYENTDGPQAFTPGQLQELRKVNLARIICDNSDGIGVLQRLVLKVARRKWNGYELCYNLPTIDLRKWKMT